LCDHPVFFGAVVDGFQLSSQVLKVFLQFKLAAHQQGALFFGILRIEQDSCLSGIPASEETHDLQVTISFPLGANGLQEGALEQQRDSNVLLFEQRGCGRQVLQRVKHRGRQKACQGTQGSDTALRCAFHRLQHGIEALRPVSEHRPCPIEGGIVHHGQIVERFNFSLGGFQCTAGDA